MTRYVLTLYREYPLASLHTSRVSVPKPLQLLMVEWGRALCGLRVGVKVSKEAYDEDDYESTGPRLELVDKPERPYRALENINRLVRASVIAHGRTEATSYDIGMVRHIVLSSGIGARGRALAALLAAGGTADTSDMMKHMHMARPNVLRYVRELVVTGLATAPPIHRGKRGVIVLADYLVDLIGAPQYREDTHEQPTNSAATMDETGRDADPGLGPESDLGVPATPGCDPTGV
jgi:hypothetical protein